MNRIFIGYDDSTSIAYDVLRYSLLEYVSAPLDIRPLVLQDLDLQRPADPLASTEFTYSRFLVPWLCQFQGTALYMDSDMLCLGDVMEIFRLDLAGFDLRVVKHDHQPNSTLKMQDKAQSRYPRKNWSSLMLLNCARLTQWTKQNVQSRPAQWLHRFETIPDDKIGSIPEEWNVLDRCAPRTKLIHYTEGGPWLADYAEHPCGAVWFKHRDAALNR